MRRTLTILIALILLAAACGGNDSTGGDGDISATDDSGTETSGGGDDDSGGNGDGDDETDGGSAEAGEGGGEVDAGLVETLGLPECPVGAHLEADGPIEIDFWHPYTALTEEAMEDLAAGFNASQSQIVVNVEAQGGYGELLSKYRESINFDSLPAIAITDGQAFRDMVDSATVLPAQSCVEADEFDLAGIDEIVRSYYSIDGALYPSSMLVSTPVLYYNRDHFEAAGLDPDVPPTTLAEVRDAAQQIKDAGVAPTPLALLMQGWFVDTWLTGVGVELVNADNGRSGNATEATFNGPEALEIYTVLGEMNDAGLITAFSNTPGQLGHYLATAGEAASMIIETSTAATSIAAVLGGTGNLADLVAAAETQGVDITGVTDLDLNIDAAPLPGLESAGHVFISGGAMYITDSGSEAEQAAAWEFMKWVNLAAQQKIVHLKGSYLPINPDVLNDPEVQAVWANDAAGSWLATAHGQFAAIDPEFSGAAIGPFVEQRAIINGSLEDVLLGGADPATALADAETELNEALQDYIDANF